MTKSFVTVFFLVICGLFFAVGGLGYREELLQDVGIFAGLILMFLAWIMSRDKFVLPPLFWVYMGFAALIGFDIMTRGNPFYSPKFFSLMVGGGFFWTAFYNISRGKYSDFVVKYFPIMMVILGYVFFGGYLWFMEFGYKLWNFTFSMIVPLTLEHRHIGVFWSLILVLLFPYISKRDKYPWYLVVTVLLAIYLIFISQARSALLALLIGISVYQKNIISSFRDHRLLRIFIFFAIGVLIFISLYKPFRSLNYFTPAILNLGRMPLGIGVGRFKEVSAFYSYIYESTNYITSTAHNLFFEMVAGLGWMSGIFILWFVLSCKSLFDKKTSIDIYASLFLALSAVFFVDPAYSIPTFYWLWMSVLGIAQGRKNILV